MIILQKEEYRNKKVLEGFSLFNTENLSFYLSSLENEKSKLESFIASAPAAHLKCRKSKSRKTAIYIVNDSPSPNVPKEQYVNKAARAKAVHVLRKMLAELQVKELRRKIDVIRHLFKLLTAPSLANQLLLDNPDLAAMLPDSLSDNKSCFNGKTGPMKRGSILWTFKRLTTS
ncbi:MAG: hypothetical protein MJ092_08100 [Lachnospiraceae bacterium]|nr:hypothetical protein [Lachnospiraceae bacterium]